ncbi:MAG: Carboxypeptidase Taq (M32) metallopeptidase [Methanosaeta sp. PtaU1.Bin112]|nr:MAG: Carboxypeptidase Taq (M32) metallopeptidase [Methanosaeta sp. PtaU1.Bin112]
MRYDFHKMGIILMTTIMFAALSAGSQEMADQKNNADTTGADMTAKEAYGRLLNTSQEMAYLDTMISLSQWDQDIYMPQNATKYRSKAQSYMEDLKNKKWIDPEFGRLLSIANNGSNWSVVEKANLKQWNRIYNKRIKLPADFAARESEMVSESLLAWEKAREENNYSIFQPYLKSLVELNQEKARYWGYDQHPYDALLDDFMPGVTSARCDELFEAIKPHIVGLIARINESGSCVYGNGYYPAEKQEVLLRNLTAALGFDYESGIMTRAKRNPLTYSVGMHDVRTTLRFDEHNPEIALLDIIHECGHGLAAQGIPDEYVGMPIAIEPGMDMAEAESRIFENNFGRCRAFWEYWLPQMKSGFKPNMDNVTAEDMYRYINRLNIVPIRIDSDEVSYMLHIIIRYEIERDLFEGKISFDDLPAIWREKYRDYLGLNITDDDSGILQDVHWAYGNFGYFPAYAIASLNSAQLEATIRRDNPDLDQRFASGDFSIPARWMAEHIYRYGAIYDTPELMKMATGNETQARFFLSYLDNKYGEIYDLQ